ncbi:MAG: hypothetical protein KDD63_00940, partial [Bacteroidetes bacterium]|nr:hypothetical protein [Bacteroidota bacterium]
ERGFPARRSSRLRCAGGYDSEVGRFLSVDPMAGDYAIWSPFSYTFDNPIRFVDLDGREPEDIVYFNRQGKEIHRIKSNTIFKTYVAKQDGITGINAGLLSKYQESSIHHKFFIEAVMPNVITERTQSGEDVQGPEYQANGYQIAASTYLTNEELNSGNMIVANTSGDIIGQSNLKNVPNITPTMVKAWSMQESHAGVGGSILQVNNPGDFTPDKTALGIADGATFSPHEEINLAIRYAMGKGFSVTSVNYSDNGKTVNRTYRWNGWLAALKGYNGNGVPGYEKYINTMINESKPGTSKNY